MKFSLFLVSVLFFKFPIISGSMSPYGIAPFVKNYGDICDWHDQSQICDPMRGLGCSYLSTMCDCWDSRKIYSPKVHRCVGKAGEECGYFETEKLCTENSYCMTFPSIDDRSRSHIPVCVCLKGYFRTDNGSCVKYSSFGEQCESYRLACDPDIGLQCIGYTCQCEPDYFYDEARQKCIAKVGQKCSRTLSNCVENAECTEKMWALDHISGETKLTGYRCACIKSLEITPDGFCASPYSGQCNKTTQCMPGENLTCLNNICQCYSISQIYDKKLSSCKNLVGTKCQPNNSDQEEVSVQTRAGRKGDKKNVNRGSRNSRTEKFSLVSNSSTSTTAPEVEARTDGFEEIHGTETAECISHSTCFPLTSSHGRHYQCKCVNGSSVTPIRTCSFGYGVECQSQSVNEISGRSQITVLEGEMHCNIFHGLACLSDVGVCGCADPSLVYDQERKLCVAKMGDSCGGDLRFDMLELNEEVKQMIFINCEKNSKCLETNVDGTSRRVCVPMGDRNLGKSSLSNILYNNANVISEKV